MPCRIHQNVNIAVNPALYKALRNGTSAKILETSSEICYDATMWYQKHQDLLSIPILYLTT